MFGSYYFNNSFPCFFQGNNGYWAILYQFYDQSLWNVCEKHYWSINNCYFGSAGCPGCFAVSIMLRHLVHYLKWFSIFLGPWFLSPTLCSFWHINFKDLQLVCVSVCTCMRVYSCVCSCVYLHVCGCGAWHLQQCLLNISKMFYHGAIFPVLFLSSSLCSELV